MEGASFLFTSRWFNYEGKPFKDQQSFFSRRREVLFSRILIFSACVEFFLLLKDFFVMKVMQSVIIDFMIMIVMIASFWMARAGYQKTAKCFFLLLLNGFITFYASSLPSDRGIVLYFFPLITVAFAIFDNDEPYSRAFFVGVPIVLFLLVVITDFHLLGNVSLTTSKHGKYNLLINTVLSALMITFFVGFMVKVNRDSENLLRMMADDVQHKKEDLEKINRELDRFVYSTSHDLRAPLLSIQGLIRIALIDPDTAHDKEYFAMINDRTNKLDEFIREIIDYSRNARTDVERELVCVSEIAKEVIANLQFVEHADRIRFDINDQMGVLLLDKNRLKIVLNNLVSNAIKYQNLQESGSWVRITSAVASDKCIIMIEDNGIGIRPELQGRIFEMFYRATEKSTGSGLGLYIVKEIVDRMKGTISVKSVFGRGTEFKITLPLGDGSE